MAKRLFDLTETSAAEYGTQVAFSRKIRGQWKPYNYEEFHHYSEEIGRLGIHLGIQQGENVITLLDNGPYWHFIDMGLMKCGAVNVSLNPNTNTEDLIYISELTGSRFIFVSNRILFAKVSNLKSEIPLLQSVIFVDPYQKDSSFLELVNTAQKAVRAEELQKRKAMVSSEDPSSIFFTSGTTGRPKGAVYFHEKTLSAVGAFGDGLPFENKDKALSYLPLSHALERQYNYAYIKRGLSVFYASGVSSFARNLSEIRPNLFVTTPLLLEELYKNLDGDKKSLLPSALGGEIKMILAAGAKFSPSIEQSYWDAGIKVFQMYGITECNLITKSNPNHGIKLKTVGKPVDNVKIRIDESNGEILVKSPYVISSYYKNEAKTKETIDEDGWFHSGDVGEIEEDYLTITGRISEKFKASSGVYVSPVDIEKTLKKSPLIAEVMVFPHDLKIAAVMIPHSEAGLEWAKENEITTNDIDQLTEGKPYQKLIADTFNNLYNQHAFGAEQISTVFIHTSIWSIEGGELTATRKIRRNAIREKFLENIENYIAIDLRRF